eukprot:jgi/Chrzof1/7293/Cz02g18040.t1_PSBPL[v5.2]
MASVCPIACSSSGCKPQQGFPKAFTTAKPRKSVVVRASSGTQCTRRQMLQLVTLPALSPLLPLQALAAKAPKGFNPVQDMQDNYQFLYPFGWQEVAVGTADVVYKDVVEPLESVSVTMTTTEKKDITEYGEIQEVANTLAKDVLTAPGSEVNVVNTSKRDLKGRNYYEFEFTAKTHRFTRHTLAVVAVNDGKFYTLVTGAGEKRWNKMKDRLQTIVRSFSFIN